MLLRSLCLIRTLERIELLLPFLFYNRQSSGRERLTFLPIPPPALSKLRTVYSRLRAMLELIDSCTESCFVPSMSICSFTMATRDSDDLVCAKMVV